jgi:hypothetical protein
MHHLFRVIGQAKGLRLVRAILPESIDDYLNAAIMEKCRSVLIQNTSTAFPDKITNRDNPTSPYNALRTLFKTNVINLTSSSTLKCFTGTDNMHKTAILAYISTATKYENKTTYPCRIIEPDKIHYVLNDFCNAPSKDYLCCAIESGTNNQAEFHVYTNDNTIPKLIVSYIKNPAKIDLRAYNNSDIPDYLHYEIVEIAVNKYFQSVGSTTKQINS